MYKMYATEGIHGYNACALDSAASRPRAKYAVEKGVGVYLSAFTVQSRALASWTSAGDRQGCLSQNQNATGNVLSCV